MDSAQEKLLNVNEKLKGTLDEVTRGEGKVSQSVSQSFSQSLSQSLSHSPSAICLYGRRAGGGGWWVVGALGGYCDGTHHIRLTHPPSSLSNRPAQCCMDIICLLLLLGLVAVAIQVFRDSS